MLADDFIKNPQVTVIVEEYGSLKAVIMGQVNSPGLYVLQGQTLFWAYLKGRRTCEERRSLCRDKEKERSR